MELKVGDKNVLACVGNSFFIASTAKEMMLLKKCRVIGLNVTKQFGFSNEFGMLGRRGYTTSASTTIGPPTYEFTISGIAEDIDHISLKTGSVEEIDQEILKHVTNDALLKAMYKKLAKGK